MRSRTIQELIGVALGVRLPEGFGEPAPEDDYAKLVELYGENGAKWFVDQLKEKRGQDL